MEYFFLAVLWIVWCAIHSGMISLTATGFFKRRLGPHYRFYRLLFNLVATATIIPIVFYTHSLDGHVLFRWEFGNEYREYQKKVSRLFPFKWLRSLGSPLC